MQDDDDNDDNRDHDDEKARLGEPNQDIHNSDGFLCYKPISSYTRNGQKISFCQPCKGVIVRTLVEFKFDPSSPAASGSGTTSVQDWLWHLCDLRPYPELQRFRPGFEEMIRHIGRELKKNGDGDPIARAKAAPGGEWTENPIGAYMWWKSGCVRRAKERKGNAFVKDGGRYHDRDNGHDNGDDAAAASASAAAAAATPRDGSGGDKRWVWRIPRWVRYLESESNQKLQMIRDKAAKNTKAQAKTRQSFTQLCGST
ncbi:hypothetical protein CSUB01_11007 [Colletotrichum sublineola]|uniref:Uncharacterized protein n=1 Tax=Colletotrichum sublineola TaxID=1173701 RepID=A0A066XWL9_COLSU|nr:hypothetical protein CSUB01_11007 [Colletotrichum sublineola]